ncbi:MAG: hypothetical protein IPF50_14605 [Proteobacteria bacterium]|nr:hypothetical protein [Pseudomonadota bacterium]
MIELATDVERWELIEPFVTARDANTHVPVLVVRLTNAAGQRGWAEAAGVDYDGETPASMAAQVEAVRSALHDRLTGAELIDLLPAGGARNALDCALWDLRAKESGRPAWKLAALPAPHPVTTAFTIGLGDAQEVRRKTSPRLPIAEAQGRRRTARRSRPGRARGAPHRPHHCRRQPELDARIARAADSGIAAARRRTDRAAGARGGPRLRRWLGADEPPDRPRGLAGAPGVNIQLDKCGGLTEAPDGQARPWSRLVVGNMGTCRVAPAFLGAGVPPGLDGPLLQRLDRPHPIRFERGVMQAPDSALWG